MLGASDPTSMEMTKSLAMKVVHMTPMKDSRFAIVQYDETGKLVSEFVQSDDKPVVLERIRSRVKYAQGSNVVSGMLAATSVLKNSGRPDAKRKIILFTSGRATSTDMQLQSYGDSLRDQDVKVIVVAVGDDVDPRVTKTAGTDEDVVQILPLDDTDVKARETIEIVLKGEPYFLL